MPKWGLSMQEGTVVDWAKAEGDPVAEGDSLVDVETSKITNVFEAPAAGTLRRIVASAGETLPVGALLAVMAPGDVSDGEIDAFVTDFQARFAVEGPAADEAGLATREIDAGGVRLRVGSAGETQGELPVVLVHGFGGDLENWTLLMGPLAETRPVHAIELPGHGQSQKEVNDPRVTGLAKTVVAALDALGVARAHLVGHSLGGAVCVAAALAAPQRVASLSLIASAGVPGATVNRAYLDGFIDARRARDLKPVAEMLFADKALATGELVEALSRYKRIDGVEQALASIRDAMTETDELEALAKRLDEVRAPLLLISASADEIVSAPTTLPASAKHVRIDGAGHLPQIERAAETAAALVAHMQG
jgi:pyruvate dehydrogenase E2 component (dihydrolipoamide acetyltransferase)